MNQRVFAVLCNVYTTTTKIIIYVRALDDDGGEGPQQVDLGVVLARLEEEAADGLLDNRGGVLEQLGARNVLAREVPE